MMCVIRLEDIRHFPEQVSEYLVVAEVTWAG